LDLISANYVQVEEFNKWSEIDEYSNLGPFLEKGANGQGQVLTCKI